MTAPTEKDELREKLEQMAIQLANEALMPRAENDQLPLTERVSLFKALQGYYAMIHRLEPEEEKSAYGAYSKRIAAADGKRASGNGRGSQ